MLINKICTNGEPSPLKNKAKWLYYQMIKMMLIIPYMNAAPTSLTTYTLDSSKSPATVQSFVKLPVIENSYYKSEVWSCINFVLLVICGWSRFKRKYNTYSGCFSLEVKEGKPVWVYLVDSMPLLQKHQYLDFQTKNYQSWWSFNYVENE